jgi:hypothetical protein
MNELLEMQSVCSGIPASCKILLGAVYLNVRFGENLK